MGTIGDVTRRGTVQKWVQNKKIPPLKFYSERAYQIRHWAFLPKRG